MAGRNEIIRTVGSEYLTANVEEEEWKYSKSFKDAGKEFIPIMRPNGKIYDRVDIRLVHNNITVLIETKVDFEKSRKEYESQLQAYVSYEKALTGNKTVAILANTSDERILVWRGPICDANLMEHETKLRTFKEYADFYTSKVNDKEQVMRNTYMLNKILNCEGIKEKLRSQFVGTCLLALKNGVKYEDRTTKEIIASMDATLDALLRGDVFRGEKLAVIKRKVLEAQTIVGLSDNSIRTILRAIENNILPFINDRSTAGQDLLNLFFITFNKYVGKADKNQAFTPDHITDFMAKVCEVNRHSRVLDATCGSGSFLVRAMTQAMDDCATEAEQEEVKKNHIFGIEWDQDVFGLAVTNMLIHGDGNSNIKQGSCFDNGDWIADKHIDVVLMNPPYNANKTQSSKSYIKQWKTDCTKDPSQGFHFVKFVADHVKKGKMAVLLPMQCAIGTNNAEARKFKQMMLDEHTLDAVFTLPNDIFHPGASASVCCMVFTLGKRHDSKRPTFFGYYKNDGYRKQKELGRIERTNADSSGMWTDIEERWLDLYRSMREVDGLSAIHCVTASDEWLCEAYMKTDYTALCNFDFQYIINNYISYLVQINEYPILSNVQRSIPALNVAKWEWFSVGRLFRIEPTKGVVTDGLEDGIDLPYLAAKHSINGFSKMCSTAGIEDWKSDGNCIIFIQIGEGSCGYANYSQNDFIGMKGKTACGYIDGILTPPIGIFLTTILCCERPKYSFGRSWTGNRLTGTVIKLPIQRDNEGTPIIDNRYRFSDKGYIPDWRFMEDYIKSLPYGDRL